MLVAALAIAPLLALVAVDAWGDWKQQTELRNDSATGELGGEASLPLFVGAQVERRLTAAYLARPTEAAKKRLDAQRTVTDNGVQSFRHLSGTKLETDRRHKWAYVERVYKRLDGLSENRRDVDSRTAAADDATGYYTDLLATMVEFYQALSAMDDAQLTEETRPLVGLFWASEGASQEDALIAQAQASGRMSTEHRRAFAEAYGAQRVMYQRWIAPYLPKKDKRAYDRIVASSSWRSMQRIERDVISAPTTGGTVETLPGSIRQWDQSFRKVSQQTAGLNLSRTQGLLAHGYERADQIRDEVYFKSGISGALVVALAALIIGIIRSITRRLRGLQRTAEETSLRLPDVVRRLQSGQLVDPQSEFPESRHRGDEFTGLEVALTEAQRATVNSAAAQAADRRGFAGFVAHTSARALNLIGVQLARLAELEGKYGTQPEHGPVLQDFITVDKPGVAVRRHLDNLATLAGDDTAPYTEPKLIADIVLDAAAETEAPERVTNKVSARAWISPHAVNDVMHVVAALLDNALSYSRSGVTITSVSPMHGVALHIEDMGTGMTPAEYEAANAKLSTPPTFESMAQTQDGRLGLFVVGQLAQRHGLRVSLRPSDYGGTTAVVMVPHHAQCPAPATPQSAPPAPAPVVPQQRDRVARREPLPTRHTESPPPHWSEPPAPPLAPPAATAPQPPARRTDPHAPTLPRRRPQTHIAPQLAHPATPAPMYAPAADATPEEISANWGAWQSGNRAADSAHHQTKDQH